MIFRTFSHIKLLVYILLFVSFIPSISDSQEKGIDSAFGFRFGMSDDDAKRIIESGGKTIVENKVDSKEVRTILFSGSKEPIDVLANQEITTEIEFYKDKLMSVSLIVNSLDYDGFAGLQQKLLTYLENKHGKPTGFDKLLSFNVWNWNFNDVELLMSSNSKKRELKLEYKYIPIISSKINKEIEKKRKGEVRSPVDQMFKDGNYSRPTKSLDRFQ